MVGEEGAKNGRGDVGWLLLPGSWVSPEEKEVFLSQPAKKIKPGGLCVWFWPGKEWEQNGSGLISTSGG